MTEQIMKKQKWTTSEDKSLISLVSDLKKIDWKLISIQMSYNHFHKNPNQCKHRWNNHLNPLLKNEKWEKFEEEELLFLYEKLGPKWKKISDNLIGRSDNCIKNKFFSLIRKGLRNLLKYTGYSSKRFNINVIRPKILSNIYLKKMKIKFPQNLAQDICRSKMSIRINDYVFKEYLNNDLNKKTNKFIILEILKYIDKSNKEYIIEKKKKISKMKNKRENRLQQNLLKKNIFKIKRNLNKIQNRNHFKLQNNSVRQKIKIKNEIFKNFLYQIEKNFKFFQKDINQMEEDPKIFQKSKNKLIDINDEFSKRCKFISSHIKNSSFEDIENFMNKLQYKYLPEPPKKKKKFNSLDEKYQDVILQKNINDNLSNNNDEVELYSVISFSSYKNENENNDQFLNSTKSPTYSVNNDFNYLLKSNFNKKNNYDKNINYENQFLNSKQSLTYSVNNDFNSIQKNNVEKKNYDENNFLNSRQSLAYMVNNDFNYVQKDNFNNKNDDVSFFSREDNHYPVKQKSYKYKYEKPSGYCQKNTFDFETTNSCINLDFS